MEFSDLIVLIMEENNSLMPGNAKDLQSISQFGA